MTIDTLKNNEIAPLCSFKLSGTLPELIIAHSVEELQTLKKTKKNPFILGKGSNTLINPDHHYDAIIKLGPKITEISRSDSQLTVPASTSVNKLMSLSQEHSLSGLEFSAGVPASIGGMVTMNFGCWGNEIAERIDHIRIIDAEGKLQEISQNDCQFDYRSSRIQKENWAVLDVTLNLSPDDKTQIHSRIQSSIQERLKKQPLREATFGSIFKNPYPHYAAELIEKTGLKGQRFARIKVSNKHANFLENLGDASYKDAINTINHIQSEVKKAHGITLIPEVQLMRGS